MSVTIGESAEEEMKNFTKKEEEEDRKNAEDFGEAMSQAASSSSNRSRIKPQDQVVWNIPESVDDFLRNFLHRAGLSRTLSCFEAEWYRSAQKLLLGNPMMSDSDIFFVPDALTHRQILLSELDSVQRETHLLRKEVAEAGKNLMRMQRERDFHQLQHRRVTEQKDNLAKDLKQLKERLRSYEPTLRQLEEKHQAALRHKMLISLQRERVQNSTDLQLNQQKNKEKKEADMKHIRRADKSPEKSSSRHPKDSTFPVCCRLSSPQRVQEETESKTSSSFSLFCSIRAHELPISCIALHPRKRMFASASDDQTWRLWARPASGEKVGQKVLTGEGHSDWLSGCSFHPDGSKVGTTSGDMTVRLWDSNRGCCVLMLSGHTQPTWGCSFHSCGHFLASCSADRTVKLWDLNSQRCRLTLRCHAASVNSVSFLPFSNRLLTCSADKTVAMWDARLSTCTSTFHGHQHPCNHTAFSPATHAVASCDSRGVVHLWDLRKPESPKDAVDAGPLGANQVAFSQTGKLLAVASSDGLVRLVEVDSCRVSSLMGHKDAVQSVTFHHEDETLMSAGSDGLINIWS